MKPSTGYLDWIDVTYPRGSDSSCLWIFGCSHSAGDGLARPEKESYAGLVSDFLKMTVCNLAEPGGSTRWAVQKLFQSEIRSGDVVVLQTTGFPRIRFVENKKIRETNLQQIAENYPDHASRYSFLFDVFNDDHLTFEYFSWVVAAMGFCRRINCKTILLPLISQVDIKNETIMSAFQKFPEYLDPGNWFIDIGNDNKHPGRDSHKHLASVIIDRINEKP